jgi:hypothetical protein
VTTDYSGCVRSRAEKRIARRTADLGRWAVRSAKAHPNTEVDRYCAGVHAATQYKLGTIPWSSDVAFDPTSTWSRGFHETITLLTQAEERGGVPEGALKTVLEGMTP